MLRKTMWLCCSMLTIWSLVHEAKAGEEIILQVIAASQSHTELLVIRQSDEDAIWNYVVPNRERSSQGRLRVDPSSIREAFELVRKHQNNLAQRQRVKDTSAATTTFTLLLMDKEGLQISMPLTHLEQQSILRTELMKMILQEINIQQLLVKAVPMEDFFYPDSIRSERKIETDPTDSE